MIQRKKVLAIVLAGGFGTRLFPLTERKPKPLVKILDTTVLEGILCSIERAGIEKICVSTHYNAEMIQGLCREKFPNVVCKRECVPLGTAGGVKFCAGAEDETVLVVSGDAVFDFSLGEAVDFHLENGCDATIVTSRKEDPTEYGVVVADECGNVTQFCEKPPWKRVKSNLVNTGIYVLSRGVLSSIPDNMRCDFSQNLFPRLMKEGKSIKAYTPEGFWCDIGTLDEYFDCNARAALGELGCIPDRGQKLQSLVERGVHAERGVYVSQGSLIGKNVRLAGKSVVCRDTHIGDDCDISSSIIGRGARIGKGSSISCAIIGEEAAIGENCIIPEGCIIGDGSRIADGSVMKRNTRLAAGQCPRGKEEKMLFSNNEGVFVDDGLIRLDETDCDGAIARLALALCISCCAGEKTGIYVNVMCSENASYVKNAFLSGLGREGANVFDCGYGNAAMCRYVTGILSTDVGVHIDLQDKRISIRLYDGKGNVIDDTQERKITRSLNLTADRSERAPLCLSPDYAAVPANKMYRAYLLNFAKKLVPAEGFKGIKICFTSEKNENNANLRSVLWAMSAEIQEKSSEGTINISVNRDGTRACIRYGNMILDHEHMLAIILKNRQILGFEEIYADENMPAILCGMAGEGRKNSKDGAEDFMWCDASLAVIALLSVVRKRAEPLPVLLEEIPPFEIYSDEYIADVNRGETLERLSRLYRDSRRGEADGIRLSLADGNVTVIPCRTRGLKIIAEAQSMEAAKEISVKIGRIIRDKE